MNFDFIVTMKDYRTAAYYGTVVANQAILRPLIVLIPASLIYAVLIGMGAVPFYPVVAFIAVSYIAFAVLIFARTERAMLKYTKTPASGIGKRAHVSVENGRFSMRIGDNKAFHTNLRDLACVIELGSVYMIYVNASQTFVIPKKDVPSEEAFEGRLKSVLGERYIDEDAGVKNFSLKKILPFG